MFLFILRDSSLYVCYSPHAAFVDKCHTFSLSLSRSLAPPRARAPARSLLLTAQPRDIRGAQYASRTQGPVKSAADARPGERKGGADGCCDGVGVLAFALSRAVFLKVCLLQ